MEYIKSFLYYLFKINPGQDFKFYTPLMILALTLIIGSIIFGMLYKRKKKVDFAFKRLFKKLSTRSTIFGIILIILTAIRYESIPYFSMRIWIYTSLIFLAYFVYKYTKIYIVDYPREKLNNQRNIHKKEENKYLPNKKKKY